MIHDPLSRNLVLAIITGIVGDTNMGQYLKSRREKKIYNIFSNLYNDILMKVTVRDTNFNKIEQVFYELQKLSSQEKECYNYIIQKHHFKKNVGYIILNQKKMKYINDKFDDDIFISVSKHAANNLAEESKKLSLLAYYDNPQKSDLIQFRMRRCHSFKEFDLREVMNLLSISNGGGHEGAIGFRIPKDSIKDLDNYVSEIIEVVSTKINRL